MPRSVNAVAKRARRKKVLKQAKGYFGRRKNVWTVAKNAVDKAMLYAYRDRKTNKRNFRSLWITRINAAARLNGLSYSQFMGKVKANDIELNRKVLADLAMNHPDAFKAVVDKIKPKEGTQELIKNLWQNKAAGFGNCSQNYSQIALAAHLIPVASLLSAVKIYPFVPTERAVGSPEPSPTIIFSFISVFHLPNNSISLTI